MHVILVDDHDREIGVMEKMEAHEKGLLHRAFSVFIYNTKGKMLLQQRALKKYHSGGLWTNACCSHPAPGENTLAAAKRRLHEELGFSCELKVVDVLKYYTEFENGLAENEFDHIIHGFYDGPINPNLEEVANYQYVSIEDVDERLRLNENEFTVWFKLAYPIAKKHLG